MGYFPRPGAVVMRNARRIFVAHNTVVHLAQSGYVPPVRGVKIQVAGRGVGAALTTMAYQFLEGRYMSPYDFELAKSVAFVITGGNLSGPTEVSEEYLLELEREAFMRHVGEPKTQDRIRYLLEKNKPLRN
jgi:3-hydroxyacyl-CoA dehydrogenase